MARIGRAGSRYHPEGQLIIHTSPGENCDVNWSTQIRGISRSGDSDKCIGVASKTPEDEADSIHHENNGNKLLTSAITRRGFSGTSLRLVCHCRDLSQQHLWASRFVSSQALENYIRHIVCEYIQNPSRLQHWSQPCEFLTHYGNMEMIGMNAEPDLRPSFPGPSSTILIRSGDPISFHVAIHQSAFSSTNI